MKELKEEVTRMLKANNPHAPQNIVRFSYKDKCYKPIPHIDQLAIHFQVDGTLIHKESDEAKRQSSKKEGDAGTSNFYISVNKFKNKNFELNILSFRS